MNQEVETNDIPMLLVAIGRWFLHVLVPGIEIDSVEIVAANGPSKGIDSGFANSLADRVACASGCRVAIERKSSMGSFTHAA